MFYTPPLTAKSSKNTTINCFDANYKENDCDDKKIKLSDSVDYKNAGPKMNVLSVFMHARDQCFVTSEYVSD